MASKQTRRSISVRGTTYAHLRDFCAQHDRSMSDVVEELLSRILEDGQPKAKTVAALLARAAKPEAKHDVKPDARPEATPARFDAKIDARPVGKPIAKPVASIEPKREPDRAALRVAPLPPAQAPVPRAAIPPRPAPSRPGPARPVPVQNAGRPAPTPATKVEGTQRGKNGSDYRAIRF